MTRGIVFAWMYIIVCPLGSYPAKGRMVMRCFFILLLVLSLQSVSRASSFPPYQVDSWTTANGLPHNSILSLLQTRNGFLWLATANGLARFDGVNFRVFQTGNTRGLKDNVFSFALWEDRSGALWAGTRDAGVTRYTDGDFRTFTTEDGLPGNGILRIDEDDQGQVWIYTQAGLAIWKDGRFMPVESHSHPYSDKVKQVGTDSVLLGRWRLGQDGWQRFAYGKWSPFPLPATVKDFSRIHIRSIYEDSKRRVWYNLAHDGPRYYCVQNGKLTTFTGFSGVLNDAFVTYQDASGLWLSDHQGNTARMKQGHLQRVKEITTYRIFRVLADTQGNEWIATQDQGLFRLRQPSITSLVHPGGSEIGSSLLRDRKGTVWIGSIGLVWREAEKFTLFRRVRLATQEWNPTIVNALQQDSAGTLWVGTREGLCIFRDGRFIAQPLGENSKAKITALAARPLSDLAGDLAIGTSNGVLFLKDGHLVEQKTSFASLGSIRTLLYDGADLWIGTADGLFVSRDGGVCANDRAWRFGAVNTLLLGSDRSLWVGTEQNGIFRLQSRPLDGTTTHYERTGGLPDNSVQQILEDHAGSLWYGGRSGLFRLSLAELNRFASGQAKQITSTRFGKEDGLVRDDFMDAGQPACFKTPDGKLWFSTFGAVSIVDPSRIPAHSQIGSPVIDGCLLDRQEHACQELLTAHPQQDNLEIRYTAIDFVKPEQIRFKYRLIGLDQDWIDAGTRRTAYYSHLPPGRYSFQVQAANSDGVWSKHAAILPIAVLPAFYQTWWFAISIVSCIAGSLVWSWRRRVSQLQQAHALQQAFSRQLIESQELERKRLAGELHDSLGQRLVMINNLALMAAESADTGVLTGKFRAISSEASQAIGDVKEISYNLRPFRLDRLGLTKTLDWIIRSTASAANLTVSADLANVDGLFPKESEINLFRIVQESLNNIVKHSRAKEVTISLARNESKLLLTIADDGVGFEADAVPGDSTDSGFGLVGISERAMLLGGNATIESTPGHGAVVRVEIQLPGATQ